MESGNMCGLKHQVQTLDIHALLWGEKQWQVGCGGLGCKWVSALATCKQQELQLPVGDHEESKSRLTCSRGVWGR
eukprot:8015493-Ditylum_brightwellii.AAC.1